MIHIGHDAKLYIDGEEVATVTNLHWASRYRYVGNKPYLKGMTALGRFKGGKFYVQVDKFSHRFSHGWWQQSIENWKSEPAVKWEAEDNEKPNTNIA